MQASIIGELRSEDFGAVAYNITEASLFSSIFGNIDRKAPSVAVKTTVVTAIEVKRTFYDRSGIRFLWIISTSEL